MSTKYRLPAFRTSVYTGRFPLVLRGTKYSRFLSRTEERDGLDCAEAGAVGVELAAMSLTSATEKHRALQGSLCAICLRSSESIVAGRMETNEKVWLGIV